MKTSRTARCRQPLFTVVARHLPSLLLTVTALLSTSLRADNCSDAAGRLESAEGSVAVATSDGGWQPLTIGACIAVDSQVKVSSGRAVFRLANETLLRTAGETQLRFSSPQQKRWIHLLDGLLHLITRTPRDLEVESEYVNAAVKGTEFIVTSDRATATGQVIVLEGEVVASNGQGQQAVTGGNAVVARTGSAPQSITVPALRDAVQWTLHYPPLPLPSQPRFASINAAIKADDLPAALRELDAIPAGERDADYLIMRAAIDLQRGEVTSARTQLQRALTLDDNNSTAFALQAAAEIAAGNNDQADTLLARSRSDDTIALITRSYLQQARFDLPAALATAEQAAGVNGSNAWVQARVAELALMNGDTRRADEAIKQALALNPNNGRAHALNGFLQLQRLKFNDAENAFNEAAKLDNNDPLPRLGLGLIEIRRDNLTAGREQLELAVALDPGQSLLRSYLGKAYQLEQRDVLAEDQYTLAKTFDRADPTPWLYSALLAQSQNRPFDALQMIEESIKRNDNRAVYRSRQQLDGDEATRTASQADIYRDLGFKQLAQRSAARAVTTAPGEYGGHRQLAESYADDPQYDAARASEVLQAQLLQPISATPIQPLLAETNLLVTEGAGPGALGYRNYDALFVREKPVFQIAGLGGSNDTGAGMASVSGLEDRLAYAVNYYHYETENYRENGDAKYDLGSASAALQMTDHLTATLSFNQREEETGYIEESLLAPEQQPNQTKRTRTNSTTLGAKHTITGNITLLAALNYSTTNSDFYQTVTLEPSLPLIFSGADNGHAITKNAELQAQIRSAQGLITVGVDWAETRGKNNVTQRYYIPGILDDQLPTSTESETLRENIGYIYWNTPSDRSWQAAIGTTYFELDDHPRHQKVSEWLPKIAITYAPENSLSITAAYFESLKRSLATEQTLEPTQIGGINQSIDENTGIKSEQYAINIDYKISTASHLGLSAANRDLEIPIFNINSPEMIANADNLEGKIYLNWLAGLWAIDLSYAYNKSEYTEINILTKPSPLTTQSIPLQIQWFATKRLKLSTTATYTLQEGTFSQTQEQQKQEFVLLDLMASYRIWNKKLEIFARCNNVFDESFNYQNTNLYDATPQLTPLIPERTAEVGAKLAF